jgi:hypothetical protein
VDYRRQTVLFYKCADFFSHALYALHFLPFRQANKVQAGFRKTSAVFPLLEAPSNKFGELA